MPDAALTRPPLGPRPRDARAAALTRLRRLLGEERPPDHAPASSPGDEAGAVPDGDAGTTHSDDAATTHGDDAGAAPGAAVPTSPPASPRDTGVRRVRWHLEPGAAVGVVLVAVVALLAGGLYVWQSRPAPVPPPQPAAVETSPPGTPGPPAGPTPTPSPTAVVVVDVTGKVREPGVVTLPAGSRVVDALEAAGGARRRADTTALNLARVLADGEQVRVDVPGAPPAQTGGGSGTASSPAPVDLNTADLATLEELPGVGPVLAQRILDHRESTGGFTAVDELQEVSGIGDVILADLRDRVRV